MKTIMRNGLAVTLVTLLIAGCNSSDDDELVCTSPQILNTAGDACVDPTVLQEAEILISTDSALIEVEEKAVATILADISATNSEGNPEPMDVSWTVVSVPNDIELSLISSDYSGGNSTSVSFTAPMVTQEIEVTIRLQVSAAESAAALASSESMDFSVTITPEAPAFAVVQTIAPDYSSSEVVTVDAKNEQVQTGYYVKDTSDYTVVANDQDVYHIGRRGLDTINKYSSDSLETELWSYSTQDSGDTDSRNPYTIVFASNTKAYVIRYDSNKVWIVNPEATQAADFKIGELDLSPYLEDDFGGSPNPSDAIISDGKLFIVMQRLDVNWTPHTSYVSVFDTTTDQEIETNALDSDSVKGIPLTGINPLESSLYTYDDEVFVTSRTGFFAPDLSGSKIEAIDVDDYSLREVISASTVEAPILSSVIVDDSKGYFITSAYDENWAVTSGLYEFNPTTGQITESNILGSGTEDISFIALDDAGYLWLSVASAQTPGLDVIDTNTNTLYVERLLTDLNPKAISFLED